MTEKIVFLNGNYDWNDITLYDFLSEGNVPSLWKDFFTKDSTEAELKKISDSIKTSRIIYPDINLVFRTFCLPLEKIKVIILGQDPYYNGNATGICFSVSESAKINPSLNNIYKELENEGYQIVKNGNLSHWLKQGCFMLNTSLTVEKDKPESHIKYWSGFTKNLLEYISRNGRNLAWLLMGKHASEFKYLTEKNGHKAFITSHPSPLSANRSFGNYPPFLGSGVFHQINNFLVEKIQW